MLSVSRQQHLLRTHLPLEEEHRRGRPSKESPYTVQSTVIRLILVGDLVIVPSLIDRRRDLTALYVV